MPPFREGPIIIDQRIDEDLIYELRKAGHGRRINIVDRSYDIPAGAQTLKFPGSSADALLGVIRLVPVENDFVIIMLPDAEHTPESHPTSFMASEAFEDVAATLRAQDPPIKLEELGGVYRKDGVLGGSDPGFYNLAKNPDERHIFVHTIDDLPFACASLVAGHSQVLEIAPEEAEKDEGTLGYAYYRKLAEFAEAQPDYDPRRGPKQLWNMLARVSGAAWNTREMDISDRGKITVGEEQLEVFKLASPNVRADFGSQDPEPAAALNLDTLSILLDENILSSMPNIGKKIVSFARDFLAARKLELEQRQSGVE